MAHPVDARKEPRNPEAALEILRKGSRVLIARGKKLLDFDMKNDPPTDDELLEGAIGPSGNLRAPTIVVGNTVLVGYHPDAYEEVLSAASQ